MNRVKIGLVGVGHLGKIHLNLIQQIPKFELIGVYDIDTETARQVAQEQKTVFFANLDELIDQCDAIDIVSPTLSHFSIASSSLKKSKHIFIEKPIASAVEEAETISNLVHEAGVKAQVGHLERFNPGLLSIQDKVNQPLFIEAHRLAQFNPRGTDVSVVLDLMIHDIDIVLHLVKSTVKKVSANGVSIVSDTPDIANARIEFDNGCVANLTASRLSLKDMRKSRIFQKDAYLSIDFLEKKSEVFELSEQKPLNPFNIEIDTHLGKKYIQLNKPKPEEVNAIKHELELFHQAIVSDSETAVTVDEALNALKIAYEIVYQIERNNLVTTI